MTRQKKQVLKGIEQSNYEQSIAVGECVYTAMVEIFPNDRLVKVNCHYAGEVLIKNEELENFAKADGFDSVDDFFKFFKKEFKGKIISFTISKKLNNIEDERKF